jgi:hypothetical protein
MRDPKLMLGGGFASPEAQALKTKELRELDTVKAVAALTRVFAMAKNQPARPSSGLIEWYKKLERSPR